MTMKKLYVSSNGMSKNEVSELHSALKRLKLNLPETEGDGGNLEEVTATTLRDFQTKNRLEASGKLDLETVNVLNAELFDVHHAENKTRAEKLHALLEKIDLPVSAEERRQRRVGDDTRRAIADFQKKAGIPADGKISETLIEKLHDEVIKKTYSKAGNIEQLQKTILRAAKIANLPIEISADELKSKKIGTDTAQALKSFQEKYHLPPTGELDKATLDKIQSVAVSRGVRKSLVSPPEASSLIVVNKPLRLNMTSPRVAELQKALAHFGYPIDKKEFRTQTFGKSTRNAVLAFQKMSSLPETGHIENGTIKTLNAAISNVNPEAAQTLLKYRVRGSVRDELMQRKSKMVIHVHEKLLSGERAQPLATKMNFLSGFFDITYPPPIDEATGKIKEKIHLVIKLLDSNDNPVDSQTLYDVARIQWVNFNLAGTPYQGEDEYAALMKLLNKGLKNTKIVDVKETAQNGQVTHLSEDTGLSTDDIMRLILSSRVAASINKAPLDAELFFAFIGQNLLPSLPGDLLQGTNDWETIEQLVELAARGIVFMDDLTQEQTISQALAQNLISRHIEQNRAAILQALKDERTAFTLDKPILVGNGNLKSLLKKSTIKQAQYDAVADVFLRKRGINEEFWKELKNPQVFNQADVEDFATTVDLGNVAKNHMPTVEFLKKNTGAGKKFKSASDMAKLDHDGWVGLIKENGSQIPDNIPGEGLPQKIEAYSGVLRSRAEKLFPVVALVATVGTNTKLLPEFNKVQSFVDTQPDFDFTRHNLDHYLNNQPGLQIDSKTKEAIKVVQRVHRLAPDAKTGAALINEGLHSSSQIYFTGQARLIKILDKKGVDSSAALKLYEQSKMLYGQVLSRLLYFRRETHIGNPQVIIPQTYTSEEIKEALGDIPNLEALFGSLDYCDCQHCISLYGPAAYFTDLLRFLNQHDSLVTHHHHTLTVKDVLFQRRPDLGNINLNCENTNTAMPYIDLVCEILENNIAPAQQNFSYQTTLGEKELRAIAQYTRKAAYDVLASADYPMSSSFNLWQEETRVYLNYLRVPRHKLMEAFQNISDPSNKVPSDAAIAAEYFGISSHEATIITATSDATSAKQDGYWHLDTTKQSDEVWNLMKRANLTYYELLELLMVKFVNNTNPKSEVERPAKTCDLKVQTVTHLSVQKFDLMHRFIRLWRKTGWKMWELDLLIRNQKIGGNRINGDTLVNLKKFKQLSDRLALPFEVLLAFYGDVNTEERVKADQPDIKIKPLYDLLFQNPAITNPPDAHFTRPLNTTILLGVNSGTPFNGYNPVATILSALAIKQTDLDLLKTKTDGKLSDATLSTILRYAYLARGLKLTIKDLWLLLAITNTADPFSTPQATLDLIKNLEAIKNSGLSLLELDYVLNYSPDSAAGLRDETIAQYIAALRLILLNNEAAIARLGLDETKKNSILLFDTSVLTPLTDAQTLVVAIDPLQKTLKDVQETFANASFAVKESEYIIQFNPAADFKATLVEKIKKLQGDLKDLLDQNSKQIVSHLASSFGLTDQQSQLLLETLVVPGEGKTLAAILADKSLMATNSDKSFKEITRTNFALLFNAYILVHKISLLVQRMKIEMKDLEYFQEHQSNLNTLDLAALPLDTITGSNAFARWLNLFKFLDFKSKYPEPENVSLRDILDKAIAVVSDMGQARSEMHVLLSQLTAWSKDDLDKLGTGLNLKHQNMHLDYAQAELYVRLPKCFALMKLTGVSAETMLSWANRDDATTMSGTAQQTRFAVKSKYENEDWLEKIQPLQDDLREKKRQALVEYLLEDSQRKHHATVVVKGKEMPNPLYWRDSNDLFKYFLIDVEMSACQLTSRIKQAISSVQFFVQRCFLNLENRFVQVSQDEKEDTASENAWSQWKWMKNYRVWEANRKVLFYPENWIEPELRDDKSSFFGELENELMQNEMTHDNAEAAFLNYLHKVDEVSHLEVCGIYHEMEDLNANELGYEINNVHVIARTKGIPAVYYYRKYDMNYSTWTAWEKIDVEVTGDHAVPVIYNRKLYLFWLVFTEKPLKAHKVPPAKPSDGPKDSPAPAKVLELQLAWSVKREKGWAAKKISSRKLIHPWERPLYSYNLKPAYKAVTNELWLDIYLSTSREFNDGLFYDPFQSKLVRMTANGFNETYLPWHSASFVFDGDVKDVKLKGLNSSFHFEFPSAFGDHNIDNALPATSFDYVHENFGEDGTRIKKFEPHEDGPRLGLPGGMHFRNTHLANNQNHAVNNNELRVLENGSTTTLMRGALNPFEVIITQQDLQLDTLRTDHPFFYQDNQRAFFIKPEWQQTLDGYGRLIKNSRQYRALPCYHPYTLLFIRELNRAGLDGLLTRKIQTEPEKFIPSNNFAFGSYQSVDHVMVADKTAEKDIVDFSFGGAYSIYNWEIFFHAPVMIATRLSQNQRFEEAMRWFHYIFDPTNIEALPTPQRYWVTKPFYEFNGDDYRKQRIESILSNLDLQENNDQLKAWRNNPFKPHLIARYRPVAYQRNVVMKYLDNLIAWGDQLFRQDTIESINQASLLYILAYEILGQRPQKVPNVKHQDMSFNQIEAKLDKFGNARVDVQIENTLVPVRVVPSSNGTEPLPHVDTFYFSIPGNDQLLKYWDTVEDRLFKIRHCMNIEGVVRQLPLFEPPIDPALLVKAAAAGIDLSSALNDLSVGTPRYRFRIVLQKAIEFCNEVKSLGEKLLNVLEKKDAEGLSLLRSQHEIQLLEAARQIKQKQIDEAVETIGGLQKAKALAEERKSYYDGKEFMNDLEAISAVLSGGSILISGLLSLSELGASILYALPSFNIGISGFGGSPEATVQWGSDNIARAIQATNSSLQHFGSLLSQSSSLVGTVANYQRRKEEWDFQGRLATIEVDQVQFQINAAQIRQAIAENELENQESQIDNAKTVDDYMRNKYTNQQLYSWMVTQISTVYFQSYQMAYDMAKRAEKCYRYELGLQDSSFIQFGYWDSLKKGLLAGDRLMNDLRRLEAAYLDGNKRELEITKNISLAQIAPLSLVALRETGTCKLSLPEWLFNMDYPGHYMRRIKALSVSIPCVTGPYTNVNCTLSLARNETRINALINGQYGRVDENDSRFQMQPGAISSIATSHAQRDTGLFELNFNDDRYLPFEGAGAISDWQISLPMENNYFDFSTLSDVIIHLSYTARDGGNDLAKEAKGDLKDTLPDSAMRLFSLKHEFPTEWYKFFNPDGGADQELVINLKSEHYPFFLRNAINTLKFSQLEVFIESQTVTDFEMKMKVTNTAYEAAVSDVSPNADFNKTPYAKRDYTTVTKPVALGELRLKLRVKNDPPADFKSLTEDNIDDMLLLCYLTKKP
jgi:peptidoglycan hydrolase-like protein with peptidoglycan-binding domain